MNTRYQIVNERRIGEHLLKPNVRIVAMGNREGDRGVVSKQPLPLSNRFTHVEVVADVDAWIVFAEREGIPEAAIGFYTFRRDLLNTFDPLKPDKAFATPRSSEKAWRYYADADLPLVVKRAAIEGAVGTGVASEMWAFIDIWQDVVKLLPRIQSEPNAVPVPEKLSMQYALSTHLAGVLTDKANLGRVKERATNIVAFVERLKPDFQVLFWSSCVRRAPAAVNTLPQFGAFVVANGDLFRSV